MSLEANVEKIKNKTKITKNKVFSTVVQISFSHYIHESRNTESKLITHGTPFKQHTSSFT